jgi:hypothetical protein
VLALLLEHDLVASAGAGSFRREKTLEALMQEARAHLEAVTRDAADPAITARRAAAQKRGAQGRPRHEDG